MIKVAIRWLTSAANSNPAVFGSLAAKNSIISGKKIAKPAK